MARTRAVVQPAFGLPPIRPEYLRDVVAGRDIGVVQAPLTLWQRLANQGWLRKGLVLAVIATGWEIYARHLNNPLLVPTFFATLEALKDGLVSGEIPERMLNSVTLLLKGYGAGLLLATFFTSLAMMSRLGNDCSRR